MGGAIRQMKYCKGSFCADESQVTKYKTVTFDIPALDQNKVIIFETPNLPAISSSDSYWVSTSIQKITNGAKIGSYCKSTPNITHYYSNYHFYLIEFY